MITNLQFDVVSKTYASECKQVKLPAKMLQWFIQIVDIANTQGKEALLSIEPTNILVGTRKKSPIWHVITQERHAELLRKEREYDEVAEDAWKYRDLSGVERG